MSAFQYIVLRPEKPALAVATALSLKRRLDAGEISPEIYRARFQEMLTEQPYRFVGYLGSNGQVLDEDGRVIGCVEIGDSFGANPNENLEIPKEHLP